MNNIEYSKSPKYLVDSLKAEYFKRLVIFELEIDSFKTKNSIKQDDIKNIVSALDKFLKEKNYRTNPNKVCIEMNLHIHQKGAPSIQNIPKAYIDLIQKLDTRKNNRPRKERSLISDDKNISVLKVNYLRSETSSNKLEIKLVPFSVVRKAIDTLYRLKNGYYDSSALDYRVYDKKEDEYNSAVENYEIEDEFWELFKKEKNGKLKLSDQIWYMYCKWTMQRGFYGEIGEESYFPINMFFDRIHVYGYTDLQTLIKNRKNKPSIFSSVLDKLGPISKIESFHFQIKLPENPQESGQSKVFKNEVKSQIENIIKKRPYLKPSFMPLSLLIVVLPGENQDLDVDNLARKYIVPILESAIEPPSDHLSRIKDDDLRYELTLAAKERDATISLDISKFFPNNSIASYECIKLERGKDITKGFVHVGIYSSTSHIGFVDRLFDRIYDFEFD